MFLDQWQELKIEKNQAFKRIAVEHWNWVAPAFVKHKTTFDWEPGSIIFIATFIIWFAFFLQFFFVFSLKIHLHWTHAPDGDVVPVPADRQIPRSSLGFVSSQHIFAKSVPLDTFSRSSHQLTYFGKLDLIGLSYLSLAREVNEVPFSFVLVQRRVCYHCPACKELNWISTPCPLFIPFFTLWKIHHFGQVNIFTFLWRLHQMFWHGVYITLEKHNVPVMFDVVRSPILLCHDTLTQRRNQTTEGKVDGRDSKAQQA